MKTYSRFLVVYLTVVCAGRLLPAQSIDSPVASPTGYKVPPQAILDILDAPPPPTSDLSPNQKWLVVTQRDLNHTTIAELAEPQLSLAGRRFKVYPDTRLENIGITKISLEQID